MRGQILLQRLLFLAPIGACLVTNALQYGVIVFRRTGLDDAHHVEFSAKFGELDDVTPYSTLGRKHRLHPFVELFDVSNLNADGTVAALDSQRAAYNKV